MRIAYFGYDFFVDVMQRLIEGGHEITTLFTFCSDNQWNFNTRILEAACKNSIPVCFHRPRYSDIERLKACDTKLLLAAAYPYKIPGTDLIRGVNLHPTSLPHGRGRWPLPWLLLRHPEDAGITLHKLTDEWDSGDILLQKSIPVSDNDDLETLSAKLQMVAPSFVLDMLSNFDGYWNAAVPQGLQSTYWPFPGPNDRTLDGSKTVEENLRIVRAFGNFEATAIFDDWEWSVTSASGWIEPHTHPLGTVVNRSNREVTLAVANGYIVLRRLWKDTPEGKKP